MGNSVTPASPPPPASGPPPGAGPSALRVALFTDRIATGGGLSHILDLCAGMPDVAFAVVGAPGEPAAAAPFLRLPHVTLLAGLSVREAVARFRPDLLHFHHLRPLLAGCLVPGRKLFTVHGVHLRQFDWLRGPGSRLRRAARLALERSLYRRVDRLVAVSVEDAAFLRSAYPGTAVEVIRNGIDLDRFSRPSAPRDELRRRFGFPAGARQILFAARFVFQKWPELFADAVARFDRACGPERTPVRFVAAGDGPLLAATRARAAALGVGGRIDFVGVRRDMPDLLHAADLYVLPSRWEGLPLSLLEALAAGTRCVAADAPGNREIARAFPDQVRLHPAGDADGMARAMRAALSRPFPPCDLSRFDRGVMVGRLRQLYERLAA